MSRRKFHRRSCDRVARGQLARARSLFSDAQQLLNEVRLDMKALEAALEATREIEQRPRTWPMTSPVYGEHCQLLVDLVHSYGAPGNKLVCTQTAIDGRYNWVYEVHMIHDDESTSPIYTVKIEQLPWPAPWNDPDDLRPTPERIYLDNLADAVREMAQ